MDRKPPTPKLYCAEEVAEMLRLTEGKGDPLTGGVRALHHLRRRSGIGGVRLGKRLLFTEEHIQQLLQACEVKA